MLGHRCCRTTERGASLGPPRRHSRPCRHWEPPLARPCLRRHGRFPPPKHLWSHVRVRGVYHRRHPGPRRRATTTRARGCPSRARRRSDVQTCTPGFAILTLDFRIRPMRCLHLSILTPPRRRFSPSPPQIRGQGPTRDHTRAPEPETRALRGPGRSRAYLAHPPLMMSQDR